MTSDTTRTPEAGVHREPHRRGRPPSIDEATVVAAARRIVVDEGVSRLTMRRLGGVLGLDPMVPYRFFKNKDELLEAIFMSILVDVTPERGGDAVSTVEAGFRRFRNVLVETPSLFALVGPRLLSTPAALQPAAWVVEILAEAGLSPEDALKWNTTLLSYVVGSLCFAGEPGVDKTILSTEGLPATVVSLIEVGIDFEEHFEWGFQRLLGLLRSELG